MGTRKITERVIAKGETAKIAAAVGSTERHGEIDGVYVDFRHSDLPVNDWEAAQFWYVWGNPPTNAGIIFPSEAAFGIDRLRETKSLSAETTEIFAHVGDTVSIEKVDIIHENQPFEHQHDAEVRLAHLVIKRPDGTEERPCGPLRFYGSTRIRNGALRDTFDHVVERICRYNGVDSLPETDPFHTENYADFWGNESKEIALHAAWDANDAYFSIIREFAELLDEDQMIGLSARMRSLANGAALAGFTLAKSESAKAERMGKGPMENQKKATAAVKRTDWHQAAKEIWEDNPAWAINRVAKEIQGLNLRGEISEISSISRSIKHLTPETSSSYKK